MADEFSKQLIAFIDDVVQAAGRMMRTVGDRPVFVLVCERAGDPGRFDEAILFEHSFSLGASTCRTEEAVSFGRAVARRDRLMCEQSFSRSPSGLECCSKSEYGLGIVIVYQPGSESRGRELGELFCHTVGEWVHAFKRVLERRFPVSGAARC